MYILYILYILYKILRYSIFCVNTYIYIYVYIYALCRYLYIHDTWSSLTSGHAVFTQVISVDLELIRQYLKDSDLITLCMESGTVKRTTYTFIYSICIYIYMYVCPAGKNPVPEMCERNYIIFLLIFPEHAGPAL